MTFLSFFYIGPRNLNADKKGKRKVKEIDDEVEFIDDDEVEEEEEEFVEDENDSDDEDVNDFDDLGVDVDE